MYVESSKKCTSHHLKKCSSQCLLSSYININPQSLVTVFDSYCYLTNGETTNTLALDLFSPGKVGIPDTSNSPHCVIICQVASPPLCAKPAHRAVEVDQYCAKSKAFFRVETSRFESGKFDSRGAETNFASKISED